MEISATKKKNQVFKKLNQKLILSIFILSVSYFSSQIYITSHVGTKNAEIDSISNEKENLRLENDILTSKINELRSLEKVRTIADKYNLVEKQVQELDRKESFDVAINQ
jgi:cell division protein FtsL